MVQKRQRREVAKVTPTLIKGPAKFGSCSLSHLRAVLLLLLQREVSEWRMSFLAGSLPHGELVQESRSKPKQKTKTKTLGSPKRHREHERSSCPWYNFLQSFTHSFAHPLIRSSASLVRGWVWNQDNVASIGHPALSVIKEMTVCVTDFPTSHWQKGVFIKFPLYILHLCFPNFPSLWGLFLFFSFLSNISLELLKSHRLSWEQMATWQGEIFFCFLRLVKAFAVFIS